MDSFEDFEFKPLTEGLGFHKKNTPKNTEILPPLEPKSSSLKSKFGSTLENSSSLKFDTPIFDDPRALAPKIETTRLDQPNLNTKVELPELAPDINLFSKALPRTERDVEKKPLTPPAPSIPKFNPRFGKPLSKVGLASPAIQDPKIQESGLLSVLEGKNLNTLTTETKPNRIDTTVDVKYVEVAPSALSLFLDLTVIAGLSILFMLGLVVATGLDLVPILSNASSDSGTQIGVVLLAYSVSQLYLILARSFFGQTLGEWSMDTQLGLAADQEKISYIFKLIGRTLVLTLTGFIVLPLASMIMGKDVAGRAVNLKLYRR